MAGITAGVIAKKVATATLTNKKAQKIIGWILVAIFSPFIVAFIIIITLIAKLEEMSFLPEFSNTPIIQIALDGFVPPVDGWSSCVTSEYGLRVHPIKGGLDWHTGIDFSQPANAPIYSVLDGVVSKISYDGNGYGEYLVVEHDDGLSTLYAHCSSILVAVNEEVSAGDTIALIGTTGMSTGNHLHFEIKILGVQVNPRIYLIEEE